MDVKATLEALCLKLEARQEQNGGWGFQSAQIALEPTCLAVLALLSVSSVRADKGLRWIRSHRSYDGSWPALVGDGPSGCWTTSLALLALLTAGERGWETRQAVKWLVCALPREAHWIWRWKFRALDTKVRFDPAKFGWGWVPGTASWVIPTAFGIIALRRSRSRNPDLAAQIDDRVGLGTGMLLDRACPGGGWNSGNGVAFGVEVAPHLDATAIALLALRSQSFDVIVQRGLRWLGHRVRQCRSPHSLAWAIIALKTYEGCGQDTNNCLWTAVNGLLALIGRGVGIDENSTLATTVLALRAFRGTNIFEVEA